MVQKETTPLIERLPDPEDLHYMGPMDPAILGSMVVRLHDFAQGTLGAMEAADSAVEQRHQVSSDVEASNVTPVWHDPSLEYTPAEQRKVTQWKSAYNDMRLRMYEKNGFDASQPEKVLDAVRDEIRHVNQAVYGQYLDSIFDEIAPPLLKQRVDAWREEHPHETASGAWLQVLGAPKDDQMDDDFLLNFLQWHNHRIESLQQDPEFVQTIETVKESYIEGTRRLERQSIIAKGSYRRAKRNLKSEKLQHFVADPFYAAHLRGDAYAKRGEFTAYAPVESIEGETTSLLLNVMETADHELNHGVLGMLPDRWLDEAVTEHLALVMAGRNVEDVYAGTDEKAYMAERDALDALIEAANRINEDEVFSIFDFTHAYSQAFTDNGEQALQMLLTKLGMCFGFDVLSGIQGYLQKSDAIMQEMGVYDIRKRERTSLQELRHVLAQEPRKLERYIPVPEDTIAA